MRVTEGKYEAVEVEDDLGNHFHGVVVNIEDNTALNTAFTAYNDKTYHLHVRIEQTHTVNYDELLENYPEERILNKNDKRKAPIVRVNWEHIQQVYKF